MFKEAGIRVRFIPKLAEPFVEFGESTRKREENTSSRDAPRCRSRCDLA